MISIEIYVRIFFFYKKNRICLIKFSNLQKDDLLSILFKSAKALSQIVFSNYFIQFFYVC